MRICVLVCGSLKLKKTVCDLFWSGPLSFLCLTPAGFQSSGGRKPHKNSALMSELHTCQKMQSLISIELKDCLLVSHMKWTCRFSSFVSWYVLEDTQVKKAFLVNCPFTVHPVPIKNILRGKRTREQKTWVNSARREIENNSYSPESSLRGNKAAVHSPFVSFALAFTGLSSS